MDRRALVGASYNLRPCEVLRCTEVGRPKEESPWAVCAMYGVHRLGPSVPCMSCIGRGGASYELRACEAGRWPADHPQPGTTEEALAAAL